MPMQFGTCLKIGTNTVLLLRFAASQSSLPAPSFILLVFLSVSPPPFWVLVENNLPSLAEAEDHHHLCGGEEVPAQVHHRPKGQHPAGDPGGHRCVGGDAPAGLQLGDHHPERGARQTGAGAHTGVCKGEEAKWGRSGLKCRWPLSRAPM